MLRAKKNLLLKKHLNKAKGIPKFFAIVTRKSDSTVQFRVEDKDKGRARVQAMKKCFDQKYDDCTVALEGITD